MDLDGGTRRDDSLHQTMIHQLLQPQGQDPWIDSRRIPENLIELPAAKEEFANDLDRPPLSEYPEPRSYGASPQIRVILQRFEELFFLQETYKPLADH